MNRKFRIAMVAACPFPYPRGTPIRIYRMAEALSDLGHEVHVITYHLGKHEQPSSFITHRIPELNFYKKLSPGPNFLKLFMLDPFLAFKILRLNKKYKFDIIHAHHYEGLLTALPTRIIGNTPIVFDMHTLLATELQYYVINLPQSFLKKIGKLFDTYLPNLSDHIISITEQIKNSLIENSNVRPEKISIISNGVEIEHFSNIRDIEKTEKEKTILGFAGNFASYQGIEIMLQAIDILRQTYPQSRLHLYSNDSINNYRSIINKLKIKDMISVFPSGFQNLPDQLAQSDILLNPRPDGAGHPLKLLNYMAAGKPIVSFVGSAHLLKHNENAWVIKENSPQAFADGIGYLIANMDLAKHLGENAKSFVKESFSWRSRGMDVLNVYRKLLRKDKLKQTG